MTFTLCCARDPPTTYQTNQNKHSSSIVSSIVIVIVIMAKGNKKGSRRNQEDSSEEEDNNHGAQAAAAAVSTKDLDFKERRELARRATAEKRRAKHTCNLCGQVGHVRRECPGIEDDGRGESKFTKSKGDPGATHLKAAAVVKGSGNRGRKTKKDESSELSKLTLPPGFAKKPASIVENKVNKPEDTSTVEEDGGAVAAPPADPFVYFDASCEEASIMDYIRSGRGKIKLSMKEAVAEYERVMETVSTSSNYGGCISRSVVKMGRPWSADTATCLGQDKNATVWFVLGLGRDFCYNDTDIDAAALCLVETIQANERVFGVYCDLDYALATTKRPGQDTKSQLRRLGATFQAAGDAGVPVQIRMAPCAPSAAAVVAEDGTASTGPYSDMILDLESVLSDVTTKYSALKVHMACWSGRAEDMVRLLQSFPDNVWVGIDGTVTFAKAKNIHECAFDLPLNKVLLETGGTIPAEAAQAFGQEAFTHPGLVPLVAEALAKCKGVAAGITGEQVARAASENTVKLYPLLQA